jgi:hypothetical protein
LRGRQSTELSIGPAWGSLSFGPIDYGTFKTLGLASFEIVLVVAHIIVLLAVDAMICWRPVLLQRARSISVLSCAAAVALFYDIALFGVFGRVDFIYFQF